MEVCQWHAPSISRAHLFSDSTGFSGSLQDNGNYVRQAQVDHQVSQQRNQCFCCLLFQVFCGTRDLPGEPAS